MRYSIFVGSILLVGAFSLWLGSAQTKPVGAVRGDGDRLITSIKGPALYQAYCASCHGTDATGRGPMANALKAAPTDLTRISARNGGMFPFPRVSRIIAGEESIPAGHGTREMPVWGPIFSQVDADQDLGKIRIDNLARYLREIQK
jgi:mono/diheme cytochrome c family protein